MKITIDITWENKEGEMSTFQRFIKVAGAEEWLHRVGTNAEAEEDEIRLEELQKLDSIDE